MIIKIKDKDINISDKEIDKLVDTLGISVEEAIQIWLEDNGYAVNEEQEALCRKAKNNRITATIHDAKDIDIPKKREVTRKENPTKEMIISEVAALLNGLAENVTIENAAKIITFTLDGNSYKLDLIQRRAKK